MSTQEELKKEILDEVLSLDIVMRALYSKFGTMHNAVIHLNGWQQRCARRARILSNVHVVVDYMQTWMMRYKGAPLHLPKMMKPGAVDLKARIWSQIQNYEELPQLITSIQAHKCDPIYWDSHPNEDKGTGLTRSSLILRRVDVHCH